MTRRELFRSKHRLAMATEDLLASLTLASQGRAPTYAYPHDPRTAWARLIRAYKARWGIA